jgi:tRNA (guanine37-N1)-methyltransferase
MYNKGIRVSVSEAEKAMNILRRSRLVQRNLDIIKDGGYLIFPVSEFPQHTGGAWEKCFAEFPERKPAVRDYRELIAGYSVRRECLPSSYDLIGTKILIKIPREIRKIEGDIGNALLTLHKSADSVFRDDGVGGEYRTRAVELVAGKGGTETVLTEYGFRFRLDVSKTFFSPRLASERNRVASTIGRNERILDMFAGVGPFSIFAAAKTVEGFVDAYDINPYAVSYLRENARANRLTNITAHRMNSAEIAAGKEFDRVIMNLPSGSSDMLEKASSLVVEGGVIDYYELMEDRTLNERRREIERRRGIRVEEVRKVKTYSASESIYHLLLRKYGPSGTIRV